MFIEKYHELLAADAIVIADSSNIETGRPSLTTSLRGLVDCDVEVRTLDQAVHSGGAGGVVPDALTTLARLLSTLHDDEGRVAIPGLVSRTAEPIFAEEWWRDVLGVAAGVDLIGEGSIESRLWMQPAISVLALDAPPVAEAINQLVPVARAKVSMRLAPVQNPQTALKALTDHLTDNAPWGANVSVTPGTTGEAFELDSTGPIYDAFREAFAASWGTESVEVGQGGSIPFVSAFSDQYPQAAILLTGVADHRSQAHAPDESLDLEELRKGALAEAIALRLLGGLNDQASHSISIDAHHYDQWHSIGHEGDNRGGRDLRQCHQAVPERVRGRHEPGSREPESALNLADLRTEPGCSM